MSAKADQKMARVLEIMKEAARSPIEKPIRSMGGLIGGEAQNLHSILPVVRDCAVNCLKAITYAMATLETNASMGLIVASPTAGSARHRSRIASRFSGSIPFLRQRDSARFSSMRALSVTSPCEMPLLPVLSEVSG